MIDLDELERLYKEGAAQGDFLDWYKAMKPVAPELIAMARRYQWLRENWGRVVTHTMYVNDMGRRVVHFVALHGSESLNVDPLTLDAAIDAAIDAAMQEQKR